MHNCATHPMAAPLLKHRNSSHFPLSGNTTRSNRQALWILSNGMQAITVPAIPFHGNIDPLFNYEHRCTH